MEMAREVEMPYDFVTGEPLYIEKLEAFATLVRADERNKTWTPEHWTEYERSIAETEREACAKVCDYMASRCNDIRAAALESAGENIRARGTTPPAAQPAPVPIVHIVGEIDHTEKVWSPAAVPDALTHDEGWSAQYVAGWNNCRQAVLVKEQK